MFTYRYDELRFESRRSPLIAPRAAVATSQPLAARIGLDVLRSGGNAADAAVATAAALNVVEPTMTGIGGDCFALYFEAATRQVHAVNGSGRAPAALSIAELERRGVRGVLPQRSALAVTVPGAAAAWCDTVERHGRLAIADVLAPAIALCEDGVPVSPLVAHLWAEGEPHLRQGPHADEMLLRGRPPRAGEIWRSPSLARTLRAVASGGAESFYTGRIAEAVCSVVQELGGVLDPADLAAHRSTFEAPIRARYGEHWIYECAPPGQGLAALLALQIASGLPLAGRDPRSSEVLHLLIEAMRLAFADARRYVADPAFGEVPVEGLLDPAYAAGRRALIDPARASVDPLAGSPPATSDTVYLAVVDEEGNACSFINSNYNGFGTGLVPEGCGFTLQNRGRGFSLDPAHANAVAPGKRPYHTILPGLATHADGELYACFGVMGAFMQPQGHLQLLVNLLTHGMDPQSALDAPRFRIVAEEEGGRVQLEEGISDSAVGRLAGLGHPVERVGGLYRASGKLGRGQVIARDRDSGALWAGSDGRADGCAVGY
ncbi:MAG: gamma-glutamyltransferase family protein [Chloroflexi bacterium]|nr:gamma-glutamyltransferase family protein [Chloroflexota bacterium]